MLLVLWLVMFVIGCAWWTPHPKRLLVLPVFVFAPRRARMVAAALMIATGRTVREDLTWRMIETLLAVQVVAVTVALAVIVKFGRARVSASR